MGGGGQSRFHVHELKRSIDGPLEVLTVPAPVLTATEAFLAECGRERYEGVVLWLGVVDPDDHGYILHELVPRQYGYRDPEGGVAVQIPDSEITTILMGLPVGVLILCRVHSHPGAAYHSAQDDLNRLLSHVGAISIVVPNFAQDPISLIECSINELDESHRWRELEGDEVERRFVVDA